MNKLDELTLVIPTYNRNDYLIRLLKTIPSDIKHVIVRDNGGFVTKELSANFDKVLFNVNKTTVPMFDNWNLCINDVQTKYFMIPSDDDMFYNDTFKMIGQTFEKEPDADIYIYGYNTIDAEDRVLNSWTPVNYQKLDPPVGFNEFKYGVNARFPAIVFKTETVKKLGNFDSSYIYTAADSMLIQKCLLYGTSIFIPQTIAAYRTWEKNLTLQNISSTDWMDKVDNWQTEICNAAKIKYEEAGLSFNSGKVKDEVYARNLLSGLVNLRGDFIKKLSFFKSVRYPHKALIKTQLRIVKSLFS